MQQYGSQTISGALRVQGTAVAGSGSAAAVITAANATSAGQRVLVVQGMAGQTGNLFSAEDVNTNIMALIDQNGQFRSYGIGAQILPLGTPVVTAVTPVGTAGTTTYGYRVSAINSQGATIASTEVTTTTGNATLDVTNYNTITWNPIGGAATYRVYGRYVGAEALLATITGDGRFSSYSYNDNTVAGSATTSGLNPIPNSSLAVNTSTWLATACTLTRDVSHGFPGALSGVGSGLMTATAGDMRVETSSSANVSHQRPVGITVGNTYTGSVYVYLGTAPAAQVNIRYYDAAGAYLASNFGTTGGSSSAWTRLNVTGVAPSNAVYATIEVECSAAAVGQTCWFTAPQIDPGAVAGAYTYDLPQAGAGTHLVLQQWNGATGPITEWQQYGGATMASVGNAGQFIPSVGSVGYNSALNYFGSTAANTPVLAINGFGNSSNGSGALVSIVNRNIAGTPVQVALGGDNGILATPRQTSSPAAVFRGITGQIANIQEWQDPTGVSALSYVDASGRIFAPTLFTQSLKDPTTLQGALNLVTTGYVADFTAGTGSAARVLMRLKQTAAATNDAFQLQDSTGAYVLARISNTGAAQLSSLGTPSFLLTTPVISSVVTVGTAGTTAYAYRVSAVNSWGETVASTEVQLATGNSSLSGTNYNTVTWGAVTGATSYRVYGRASGAEALLATVSGATTWNDQSNSPQAATAGLNPIPNSSLNVNTSMWSTVGCTIARDTTVAPPLAGVTAGLLTSTVASGGCNTQTSSPLSFPRQFVAVTPSTTVTGSVYVWLGTLPSATVGIQWFDSSFAIIAGQTATGGTTGGWTRLSVSQALPAGAVYCNVYVQGNETAIGQTLWFAAPQIDAGAVALPYVRDLPFGTGAAVLGGPVTAPSLATTGNVAAAGTVVGTAGVYDGAARVYSTNNPPPGGSSGSYTLSAPADVAHVITPAAGWTNYNTGYSQAKYIQTAGGMVYLQGTVNAGSTYGGGSTIATGLPVPADGLDHVFNSSDNGTAVASIRLTSTGTLVTQSGTFTSGTNVFLEGISYQAAAPTSTQTFVPGTLAIPTDVTHAVTFNTPTWGNNGGAYPLCKYVTNASGMVYLQGLAQIQTGQSAPAGSVVVSGLPLPADGLAHTFMCWDGGTGVRPMQVTASGTLITVGLSSSAGQVQSLDGIVYLASIAGSQGQAASSLATMVKFGPNG